MNPDKKIIVDELLERVNSSPFLIVVDYNTMTVPQFSELRNRLAEAGSECHVGKNRYMRIALEQAELPSLGDDLKGQTAFITGESDVCAAAKVVKNFQKEFKKPEVKSAILDGNVLDAKQVEALADLPSREVLLAQLLGVINAPASKLVRTINEPAASLARVIKAKFPDGDE
ncbi:50S ribosomal protein L10 [Roseibacillus ishigakijimensis]|uniref:Large ribosomal subunit protein uL10 n=1 Tax=Roseibacillus ishigakijimensis TaxID=454146 RepID=A0A934RPD6_9BACT|nr:50S ribosomal protein L10 [Roseibacillus ishigakijimensis]MBK1835552.1 50S ribosomal protein L10 [Roseibacillus ishigakijimensis]